MESINSADQPSREEVQRTNPIKPPVFKIAYQTPTYIFTPQFRSIKGKVAFEFTKHAGNIFSIELGFKGIVQPNYRYVQITDKDTIRITKNTFLNIPLFEFKREFFASCDLKNGDSFGPGNDMMLPIDFEFPEELILKDKLPSSSFENGAKHKGCYMNVFYCLFLRITYHSSTEDKLAHLDYAVPLKYQDECGFEIAMDDDLNYVAYQSFTYKDKLKRYIQDEDGKLTKCELSQTHKKTRAFRSIWNKNYKPEFLSTISKNITLNITCEIPKTVDLSSTFDDFDVILEVPNVEDLSDFKVNGQSTQLGLFEIEMISISSFQSNYVKVHENYKEEGNNDFSMYRRERAPGAPDRIIFDIADFQYNKDTQECYWKTTLGNVINNHNPLTTLLNGEQIVGSLKIGDFFQNSNTFNVTFKIGNSQERERKFREFKFSRVVAFTNQYEELDKRLCTTTQVHMIKWFDKRKDFEVLGIRGTWKTFFDGRKFGYHTTRDPFSPDDGGDWGTYEPASPN